MANIANTAASITDMKLTDMKLTANIANSQLAVSIPHRGGGGRADAKGPKVRLGLEEIFLFFAMNCQEMLYT